MIVISVASFSEEDVRDAFNLELADVYASLQENDDQELGRRYYAVFKALRSMERFWEGD